MWKAWESLFLTSSMLLVFSPDFRWQGPGLSCSIATVYMWLFNITWMWIKCSKQFCSSLLLTAFYVLSSHVWIAQILKERFTTLEFYWAASDYLFQYSPPIIWFLLHFKGVGGHSSHIKWRGKVLSPDAQPGKRLHFHETVLTGQRDRTWTSALRPSRKSTGFQFSSRTAQF